MKKILITDDSPKWVNYHKYAVEQVFQNEEFEIFTAYSAKEGLDMITFYYDKPFDIILTDMQMEIDFSPLYAGEWFIKQIKTYPKYNDTKIIIISAAYNIKDIAKKYNVEYIPKSACQSLENYKILNRN